jgi:hypothetical protein
MSNRRILLVAIALGFVSGFSMVAMAGGSYAPATSYSTGE